MVQVIPERRLSLARFCRIEPLNRKGERICRACSTSKAEGYRASRQAIDSLETRGSFPGQIV
jgi:hypothetical protein